MSGRQDDDPELERMRQALAADLRRRTEQVPPEVAERLGRMRRAAVAELSDRHPPAQRFGWRAGALAGAAAALVLTLALLVARYQQPEPDALLLAEAEELEAMAEMEILAELEFLAWLEQEHDAPRAGQG